MFENDSLIYSKIRFSSSKRDAYELDKCLWNTICPIIVHLNRHSVLFTKNRLSQKGFEELNWMWHDAKGRLSTRDSCSQVLFSKSRIQGIFWKISNSTLIYPKLVNCITSAPHGLDGPAVAISWRKQHYYSGRLFQFHCGATEGWVRGGRWVTESVTAVPPRRAGSNWVTSVRYPARHAAVDPLSLVSSQQAVSLLCVHHRNNSVTWDSSPKDTGVLAK